MKIYLLALASTLFSFSVFAQDSQDATSSKYEGQTSFFAEFGGPGILFSANIDRRFKRSTLGWGARVGVGFVSGYFQEPTGSYYSYDYNPASIVTFPVQVNYIFGKTNSPNTLEVGAGVTVAGKKLDIFDFYDEKRSSVFGTASFMYRRQPVTGGGFSWRIGFTPLIAQGYIQPSGGVSVGYNF